VGTDDRHAPEQSVRREKPSSGIFVLFVVYQIYRYSLTYSVWLLLITLLDIVVIWLT
jgi:uncharacterized membrane protein